MENVVNQMDTGDKSTRYEKRYNMFQFRWDELKWKLPPPLMLFNVINGNLMNYFGMVYGHNSKGGKWHEICIKPSMFTVLSVYMFLAQSTMCNAVRLKHQRVLSNKMRTCICLKWAEWEHIFSP